MDLSLARVSITSAFQGESILLFGMFDPPGEIVVVVAGPPARETVMRKQRFMGIWLNPGRQAFDDVPAYYAIAASQPLQRLLARGAGGEILSLEDRLSSLKPATPRDAAELARFRAGLVEVKRREGLYPAAIGHCIYYLYKYENNKNFDRTFKYIFRYAVIRRTSRRRRTLGGLLQCAKHHVRAGSAGI